MLVKGWVLNKKKMYQIILGHLLIIRDYLNFLVCQAHLGDIKQYNNNNKITRFNFQPNLTGVTIR